MKFLIDMNLTVRWVSALKVAGFEAEHQSEIGRRDAPDNDIMAYARDHGLIVLSQDLDFTTILALTGFKGPSVVQIRADDASPDTIGETLIKALAQTADDLERGAVLTVEPARARLRVLPFEA